MAKMSNTTRFARYKFYFPGAYYHIYNRGNGKENIFLKDEDYLFYLKRLKTYLQKHGVKLLAYCLMPNHIHLLVQQEKDTPIFKFISSLHTSYAKFINKKYDKVGHLFQDRFKQVIIESDEQLLHLSRYIHLNPVMGEMIARPEDFGWSSYREYIGSGGFSLCNQDLIKGLLGEENFTKKYREFVEAEITEEDFDKIKDAIIEPF